MVLRAWDSMHIFGEGKVESYFTPAYGPFVDVQEFHRAAGAFIIPAGRK
jgi:hypothetical protein